MGSTFDEYIDTGSRRKFFNFSFETRVGPHSPTWLHDLGVPTVVLADEEGSIMECFDKLNQEAFELLTGHV